MNIREKWIASWQKNKKFFGVASSYLANWRVFKLCGYYLVKTVGTYLFLALHLIFLFINIAIFIYVAKNQYPITEGLIKNYEASIGDNLASTINQSQMFWSGIMGIFIAAGIFQGMHQEGYDLILCSKPFYRQQIVLTKILFIFVSLCLYSLLVTIENTIVFAVYGINKFSFNIGEFLAFNFLGYLVAGFLVGALSALLSTKFSEKVSFLITFFWFLGSAWLGGGVGWLLQTLTNYSTAAKIQKARENSLKTHKSPFFFNSFGLNWRLRRPKDYFSLLYTKDQGDNSRGFSQEELNFFEEFNKQNALTTALLRANGWLNISLQLSKISPASADKDKDPKTVTPWTDTTFAKLNFNRRYEHLTTPGDITTSYLLKTKSPDPEKKNELLTITDPKSKNHYFLIPSVFIGNTSSLLEVEIIDQNKEAIENQTQEGEEQKESGEENQKSSTKTIKISLDDIGFVMGSELFHKFMAEFVLNNFYSKEEEDQLMSLINSPNVTKGWLIKRLASKIDKDLKKDEDWQNPSKLKWFIAALYWLYMDFPDQRIAKVITASDDQLTDFQPKPLEVSIGENKYIIGKKVEGQAADYFRPNYLFSYTQNYVVFEKWANVVSWWVFVILWIFLALIFNLALTFVLLRRDYK